MLRRRRREDMVADMDLLCSLLPVALKVRWVTAMLHRLAVPSVRPSMLPAMSTITLKEA